MTTIKSLKISDLEIQIRNLLGDNTNYQAQGAYENAANTWSTALVIDGINFATKEYCKKTGCSRAKRSVSLITDPTPPYALNAPHRFSVPSDCLEVVRVLSTVGEGILTKTSRQEETLENPFWELESGVYARSWYMMDSRTIQVWPQITYAAQPFYLEYIQAPWPATTSDAVYVTAVNAAATDGQWYEIVSVGNTNFVSMGASASTVGVQFQATAVGTGTGTVREIVDPRIIPAHQEYLRYAAATYLLNMAGDAQSIALAEKFLKTFNDLIGV